jgi:hypothetical protein
MKLGRIIGIIIVLIIIVIVSYRVYERFQTQECSTIDNCKACTNSFGCLWCVNSNKCVSDLSNSILCPQESTLADPMSCDVSQEIVEDNSGSTFTGGKCSINSDCKSCLTSPGCFWCDTKKICSSNEDVYSDCIDEKYIFNSIEQCNLKMSIDMNYPATESIMPISGLSRNLDGSLTNQSLKIIFDSFASKGNAIIDSQTKQNALQMVENEKDFYNNKFKSFMNTYVDNSIDYNSDSKSLDSAKDIKNHIQDLNDVSRYINNYDTTNFVEGYQNFNESKFDYVLQENKAANSRIQLLWLGNLIAIGTLFYLMK